MKNSIKLIFTLLLSIVLLFNLISCNQILDSCNQILDRFRKKDFDTHNSHLKEVMDGDYEYIEKTHDSAESITAIYKVTKGGESLGHIVELCVLGYASEIKLAVGFYVNGKIKKVVVIDQAETHGKTGMSTYVDNFINMSKDEISSVDTFSGATISSTAIKRAIIDAANEISNIEP